jgi:hypothetical protein
LVKRDREFEELHQMCADLTEDLNTEIQNTEIELERNQEK